MRLPALSLVIGGAASGKSAFAEALVGRTGRAKVYVATAEVRDAEMERKIAAHRARRQGLGWRTVEEPMDLGRALSGVGADAVVLVDCMTFWLTNQMLADTDVALACDDLCQALDTAAGPVVLVTNDVSGGIVPDNALARAFRNAQGGLNQRLAAQADLVVQVTAGLPLVLKGEAAAISGQDVHGAADRGAQTW